MFEQTFVQAQAATRKPWTVAVSLSVQCLVVAILFLIPLLRPEVLRLPEAPKPHLIRTWITQPPMPPQKASSRSAVMTPARSTITPPPPFVFVPPTDHSTASRQVDVPSADSVPAGWAGPSAGAFGPALMDSAALPPPAIAHPPVQPTPAKTIVSGPVRIGGGVEGAKLVYGPHPTYPAIAKTARSEGVVRLEAVIAADGSIRNLRAVSGPALLVAAALDAVRQWRYQPTLLNGVAVEVLTEIDVSFTLR